MASDHLVQSLSALIKQAGSDREAAKLIESIKGYAPTHSALYKTRTTAAGSDYVVASYIADLRKALGR